MSKYWSLRVPILATIVSPALSVVAGCSAADGSSGPVTRVDAGVDAISVVDAASPSLDDAGDGGDLTTSITQWTPAHAARSLGFSGTSDAYYALYNVACQSVDDCVAPCVASGGTTISCSTGSDCVQSAQTVAKHCLPPTYWLNVDKAVTASGSTVSAAEIVLVAINYHDALLVTDFGISIPDGASVKGIQFDVHRNADDGFSVDDSIRVVRGGAALGDGHAGSQPWSLNLEDATYGGPDDLWGASWVAADLRSTGFGILVTPRYTGPSAGNDRAHVDAVRARVFYAPPR